MRQLFIDRRQAKGQYFALFTPMPFDALQIAAHLGNRHGLAGLSHPQVPLDAGSMFLFCSRSRKSQMDSSRPDLWGLFEAPGVPIFPLNTSGALWPALLLRRKLTARDEGYSKHDLTYRPRLGNHRKSRRLHAHHAHLQGSVAISSCRGKAEP